jgi:hypothetical protein
MITSVRDRAHELRTGLEEAPSQNIGLAVEFANEFAIAPRLRHTSIVLKLEHENGQTPAAKARRWREWLRCWTML